MPQQQAEVKSPYQENAWGMGEGKRLYAAYNCAPCHGVNGGGAIGPPLIDDKWIYGAKADQIYATISQGRPDGMPSFGGHITHAADLAAGGVRAVDVRPGPDRPRRPAATTIRWRRCPSRGGPRRCPSRRDTGDAATSSRSSIPPASRRRVSAHLWWVMFWICAACLGRRRDRRADRDSSAGARRHPTAIRLADRPVRSRSPAASAASLLIALLFQSVVTGRALDTLRTPRGAAHPGDRQPMVVGRPVRRTPIPSLRVTTANEIHIPVGRPDRVRPAVERRDSQPLDSQPAGQDRSGAGPPERALAAGGPAGRLPRPVRRVLRRFNTPRWRSWWSPSRPTTSSAGWPPTARRRRAPATPEQQRGKDVVERGPVRDVPHHRRHARPEDAPRPT